MDGQPATAELYPPIGFFGAGGGCSCANTKIYATYLFCLPEEAVDIYEGEYPSEISAMVMAVEARGETYATGFSGKMENYNFEVDLSCPPKNNAIA